MLSVIDSPQSGIKNAAKKEVNEKSHKIINLLLVLLMVSAVTFFIIWPKYEDFLQAEEEIVEREKQIQTLETQKIALELEIKNIEDKMQEKVQTISQNMLKLFPEKENLTDLVRLFDNFSYNFNSLSSVFDIQSISFGKIKKEKNYTSLEITMSVKLSKENIEKFLYLIECSGTLNVSELINQEKLAALQEILTVAEKDRLQILLEKDFKRTDVISYLNEIQKTDMKEKLINELFAKALFYQELKEVLGERYYPVQVLSLESFSFSLPGINNQEEKEDVTLGVKLKAYYR